MNEVELTAKQKLERLIDGYVNDPTYSVGPLINVTRMLAAEAARDYNHGAYRTSALLNALGEYVDEALDVATGVRK